MGVVGVFESETIENFLKGSEFIGFEVILFFEHMDFVFIIFDLILEFFPIRILVGEFSVEIFEILVQSFNQ